uniref:Lines homolog 1 n=1 Tax=Esox lucius TaxID=8010 RepID=A0A3P8ZB37_ESOLU
TQLLPQERDGQGDSASDVSCSTVDWATTLSTLLNLLEVLTAARFKLSAASVRLTSPRLSLIQASPLLHVVDSHVNYFVKKQVLLLLKRTLLYKAGEDMALAEMSAPAYAHDHMTSDIHALADGVLQAVHANWLKCVPVKSAASSFGGTSLLRGGSITDSDHVMLRAVSLVVLKSVEYKIQSAGGNLSQRCSTDVYGCLSALLLFLSQHGVRLGRHPCRWVSLVFGEQDDDMMEAAKSLLLLYLHQRGFSGLDGEAACTAGRNPHCHFLFFLHSISFDHSILLDFLISTETCFLEYFVRYLKHLCDDWDSFRAICQKMDSFDHLCLPSCSTSVMASPLRLVDYGSSDESETEMESTHNPQFGESQWTLDPVKETPRDLSSGPTHVRLDSNSVIQTHNSVTLCRMLRCLTELRVVVDRLQRKSLFPYNSKSLLKLLMKIEKGSLPNGSLVTTY